MHKISAADLVNKTGSVYKLVILTARRAIELGEGAARLVNSPKEENIVNIALKEIAEGKISCKIKPKEG